MPGLIATSDDDEDHLPRHPGSSTDGQGVSTAGSDPLSPTDILPAEAPPPQGGASSATGIALGTDTRGLGLETFEGRGSVRVRKGVYKADYLP